MWPFDAPVVFVLVVADSGWPSTTTDKFPHLSLAISPPRQEEGEIVKDPKDGWSMPDPTLGPTDVWGRKDDPDPPPLDAFALAS